VQSILINAFLAQHPTRLTGRQYVLHLARTAAGRCVGVAIEVDWKTSHQGIFYHAEFVARKKTSDLITIASPNNMDLQ
jgi:hypothetical protein